MPSVKNLVSFPEVAKEVFEDDSDISLLSCLDAASSQLSFVCGHPSTSGLVETYQDCKIMRSLTYLPSYQAAILLTEHHLVRGDCGPLPHHLKTFLLGLDMSEVGQRTNRSKSSQYDTKNLKHFEKYVALTRVNRIMAKRPWAINKHHIEDLRLANLSLSEIVHSLLILAHNHAMQGISSRLQSPQGMKARNHINKNLVKKIEKDTNNDFLLKCDETHSNEFQNCISHFDDKLHGISCERYWDDFGYSILNCLSEKASHVIDNRFTCLRELRRGNKNISSTLETVWRYSQKLLGFGIDDYDNELIDETLDEDLKYMIHCACLNEDLACSDYNLSLLTVVTVQEAKMQAQVIYVLHAVKQFMNW